MNINKMSGTDLSSSKFLDVSYKFFDNSNLIYLDVYYLLVWGYTLLNESFSSFQLVID